MKTLLDKAKAVKVQRKPTSTITKGKIELAIGWMRDEINTTQACRALDKPITHSSMVNVIIAKALREGIRRGIIKLVVIK